MGQKVGKAAFVPAAKPFLNANKDVMEQLWNRFNDIADGFGLSVEEFSRICDIPGFNVQRRQIETLFQKLDTDKNGRVDALEFLTTLALASGLNTEETIAYTFRCYDYDESRELSIDEMTLSLKSTLTGLAKLTGEEPPDDLALEDIAVQAFSALDKNHDSNISFVEYQQYCLTNPEMRSFLDYYDDPEEDTVETADFGTDSDIDVVTDIGKRSILHEQARNPEMGFDQGSFELDEEVGGDEFLATRPWLGVVENTVPTGAPKATAEMASTPPATLRLQWIHGYRSASWGCVRYNSEGDIVYPAAGVGVRYTPGTHSQAFNLDHTDDVVSLAMHPQGRFVATGEMGRTPKIVVWDSLDKEGLMDAQITLQGFHRRAVVQLDFSPNGKYLASVGQDDDHSVAIYEWKTGKKVFSEKSDKSPVLACCWQDDNTFITCGVNHIYFWDVRGRKKAKGLFGRAKGVKRQALLSVAPIAGGRMVVTGTASGHLYAWQGRNCVKAVQAHSRNLTALYSCDAGLVSGGKDGRVRTWNHSLEPQLDFDMTTFGSYDPAIRSVCWDELNHKVLVGTNGAEIYELSSRDGSNMHAGALITGHCKEELWGAAMHPNKPEYCTCGDDKTLRVWDINTRRQIKMIQLDDRARAVTYSPDGSFIAVGLGGRVGVSKTGKRTSAKEGGFAIFREGDLGLVFEGRAGNKWISDIRFSPNAKILAVGGHDSRIYLFKTSDFSPMGVCSKNTSSITHFDFSTDSNWLQVNDQSYFITFYDAKTGSQQTSAPAMRDVNWATWTCTLGWPVQGIWPPAADGTDINAVDRSKDGQLLATADDFGRVKLFRYPCIAKRAASLESIGHSSHVMNVRFSHDDQYLITCGGNDRCVLQWNVIREEEEQDVQVARVDLDSDDEVEIRGGLDLNHEKRRKRTNRGPVKRPQLDDNNKPIVSEPTADDDMAVQTMFAEVEDDELCGDEFLAVKPWKGAIVPPTDYRKVPPNPPDEELQLQWVHGYRSLDSRNNLRYTRAGPKGAEQEIVYHAAGVGITLNSKQWHQKFNLSHRDDIVSLAVHPDGVHVATGEMGRTPSIVVWRSDTMEAVAELKGVHRRAVSALAFSKDGRFLASVGEDDDHTMALYDWESGKLKVSAKGDKNKSLAVAVSPDGRTVCQAGVKFVKFHGYQGRNPSTTKARFGRKGKLQPFLSAEYYGNNALVSTMDGHVYKFTEREITVAAKVHTEAVFALYACDAGIVTGSKDGKVKILDGDLATMHEFDLLAMKPVNACIRSVCWDPAKDKILVGTLGSEIYEISSKTGENLHPTALINGHFRHELWGLASHPSKSQVCTVGDDGQLCIWDVEARKLLRSKKMGAMCRAVAYSPNGRLIAVGMGGRVGKGKSKDDGKWVVLNESDLTQAHTARDSKQWISDIKFSPDGSTLAVGGHDRKVYLYDVATDFAPRARFDRHNSYITHFDFSEDGRYMQSCDGAYEYLFADTSTGAQIPSASTLKDTTWATWTCTLGWPVQGIWPPESDGTDVNAVDRSKDGTVLATADDFGTVKLFRYPSYEERSPYKVYRGHSSHVTNIRFTADDRFVFSAGGNDRCLFQWGRDCEEPDHCVEDSGDSDFKEEVARRAKTFDARATAKGPQDMQFELDDAAGGGDEFLAVKPWKGAIVEPTLKPDFNPAKPQMDLTLEWAYGYRAQDASNNLRYNDAGEIVYSTAAVGVIYNKQSHTQKFHLGHDDDIVSLAVDPTCNFVATGQMGKAPRVRIWDSESGNETVTLPSVHARAVTCLAFSPDGKQLLSVGADNNHSVVVSETPCGDWTDGRIRAKAKGSNYKTLFANFTNGGGFAAVTGGVKHVNFWNLSTGGLSCKRGRFGKVGKAQPQLCAAAVGDKTVTGSVSGELYVWQGNSLQRLVPGHKGTVYAMYGYSEGMLSGGTDGTVRIWSPNLDVLKEFDITRADVPPLVPVIRSVCIHKNEQSVLVGTRGSEIYEISTSSGATTLLAEGHCKDELWGLATHPTRSGIVATAGDDSTIRVWDTKEHKLIRKTRLDTPSRTIAFSPDGNLLACGLGARVGGPSEGKKVGGHMVLHVESLEPMVTGRDSKDWIRDIRFNAEGSVLAVASGDQRVRLYDARGGKFALYASCTKSHSALTHIDFSKDGAFLQTNDSSYELLYYNAKTGEQVTSAQAVRDVQWDGWTCTLGWPVEGIWPERADGTDINAVARSTSQRLLATSDDWGHVKVYNYPVRPPPGSKTPGFVQADGHSSHVTNVRFNCDDSYLMSCGGNDRSLMQWRITYKR